MGKRTCTIEGGRSKRASAYDEGNGGQIFASLVRTY